MCKIVLPTGKSLRTGNSSKDIERHQIMCIFSMSGLNGS